MKPQTLWIKCPVCEGTKKTRTDFRDDLGYTLPAGSPCFACCEGPEGAVEVAEAGRRLADKSAT